jgi:intracellular sulfur oxidation DsrE/DsrF family protein
MRRLLVMIAILAAAVATSRPLSAQSAGAPDWRYPVIRDYGGVVALPDAAFQPKAAAEYKLVFSVSEAAKDADTASPGLIQVARFLNLLGLAEADPGSADLAVVIFGAATPAVLGGDAYRRAYDTLNPNANLIDQLTQQGVRVLVCGQALAGIGATTNAINAHVEVATAATLALADLQAQGYRLVPH